MRYSAVVHNKDGNDSHLEVEARSAEEAVVKIQQLKSIVEAFEAAPQTQLRYAVAISFRDDLDRDRYPTDEVNNAAAANGCNSVIVPSNPGECCDCAEFATEQQADGFIADIEKAIPKSWSGSIEIQPREYLDLETSRKLTADSAGCDESQGKAA